jgi:hypothetical protein
LRTVVRGVQAFLTDPEEAIRLTEEAMGEDTPEDPEYMTLGYDAYKALQLGGDVEANGLLTITEEHQEAVVATLALSGVEVEPSQLFDLSILEEVYADDPALKAVPDA